MVRVESADRPGASDETAFEVRVKEVNARPSVVPIPDLTAHVGGTLELTVMATDPDIPEERLRYGFGSAHPQGARIDPITGRFTWTPTPAQSGKTHWVTVIVVDREDIVPVSFSIDVRGSTSK